MISINDRGGCVVLRDPGGLCGWVNRAMHPPVEGYYTVWGMRYELWGMRYAVWGMRYAVWGMRYEVWGMRYMRYEVWGMRYEVWDMRYAHLEGVESLKLLGFVLLKHQLVLLQRRHLLLYRLCVCVCVCVYVCVRFWWKRPPATVSLPYYTKRVIPATATLVYLYI